MFWEGGFRVSGCRGFKSNRIMEKKMETTI